MNKSDQAKSIAAKLSMLLSAKADAKTLKDAAKRCFEFRGTKMPSDPTGFLASIDQTLLKRGWKNALATIKNPPTFDEAFEGILVELKRTFPAGRNKN